MNDNHRTWLLNFARKHYKKCRVLYPEYKEEDALCHAFDMLDERHRVFIDPTQDEYDDLLQELRRMKLGGACNEG